MKKVIDGCFLLVLVSLLPSCRDSISPAAYAKRIKEDSGLNKTVSVGSVDYTFRLLPAELMALKAAAGGDGRVDAARYGKRLAELKGHLFINIEMQLHDGGGSVLRYDLKEQAEYERRVMYYEFYAKSDLKLICNGAEIPAEGYQYENHLDLMPFNTLVAVFPICKDGADFQVLFNDRALNNLFLKANFNQDDINSLPKPDIN